MTALLAIQPEGTTMAHESLSEIVDRETEPDDGEPDDGDTGDDGAGDDDGAGEVDPDSAPVEPVEPDMGKIIGQLDRENARHEKRLADIMGDDFQLLDPCPLCDQPGFVFPFQPGTDQGEGKRAMVAAYMGDAEPDYAVDPDAEACSKCDGWGVVLSGSRKLETRTIPCDKCSALGWLRKIADYPQDSKLWGRVETAAEHNATVNGATEPDVWGRPAGHRDYGIAPAFVNS